eukprot:CAMPEP_0177796722 /NCGR_PEP_ID=MMETSP0491_2-20121128/26925_1 /TAXON_ID=63592 /ORGANISM="Tetraselmis chuii, Strain PLY429" /LENGTH=653 /DNA_ID=CAMNT_0019319653 /DNA_START=159 /DNA_END=2121 /DNA_ORIENTATION=-
MDLRRAFTAIFLLSAVLVATLAIKGTIAHSGPLIYTPANSIFPALDQCDDGVFCNGIERLRGNGTCYIPNKSPCDDGDDCTKDICDEGKMKCTYEVFPGCATCMETCTPDCSDKVCGEDGCSGFCGSCPAGLGCVAGECIASASDGTCGAPLFVLGNDINGVSVRELQLETGELVTPTCNAQTASPELFYVFTVPRGKSYGYDIRTTDYDTVVMLMKGDCLDASNSVNCNDDGTPPGDLGSRIQGVVTEGDYYIMVDGYSSADFGPFTLRAVFVKGALLSATETFAGTMDAVGCAELAKGVKCAPRTTVATPTDPCTPQCDRRECGADGCGGSCGVCSTGARCVGEGFQLIDDETDPNNGEVVSSECFVFPVCDALNPSCNDGSGCAPEEYCGRDCRCYALDEPLPDFVIVDEDLNQLYLEERDFPASSCAIVENCVHGTGRRKLLRFSSSAVNQGGADFDPTGGMLPKDRPDIYDWGECHGHWHYSRFMQYFLVDKDDKSKLVLEGLKSAYCLEDSRRELNGSTVNCQRQFDCGMQGSQRGWLDSYGWSLDCSWMDVTDVPAGQYVLIVEVNPDRVFPEVSYNNNQGEVLVTLPEEFPLDRPEPMHEWIKSHPLGNTTAPLGSTSSAINTLAEPITLFGGLLVSAASILAMS